MRMRAAYSPAEGGMAMTVMALEKREKRGTMPAGMISERAKGHMASLLAAVLFGLMSPVSKLAMAGGAIDGVTLATMRVAGSAAMFWLVSFFVPGQRIRRQDWPALVGMSLCGMALNQYFYVAGVQYTSPTNACVIGTSTPVFTLLLSALAFGQHIGWGRGIGVLLAGCGALFLVLGSSMGQGMAGNALGDAFCAISQVSAACYFVFFGSVIRRYHVITLMKWLFSISSALALPLFVSHLLQADWGGVQPHEWLSCAYVVGVGTFICYLLLIAGQKRLAPAVVATYNYVQPAVAALFGICWGVDALTWHKLLAMALIACGVWKVTHARSVA